MSNDQSNACVAGATRPVNASCSDVMQLQCYLFSFQKGRILAATLKRFHSVCFSSCQRDVWEFMLFRLCFFWWCWNAPTGCHYQPFTSCLNTFHDLIYYQPLPYLDRERIFVGVDKTREKEHSGTCRNMPEQSGKSRKIPEHPETWKNKNNFHEKK